MARYTYCFGGDNTKLFLEINNFISRAYEKKLKLKLCEEGKVITFPCTKMLHKGDILISETTISSYDNDTPKILNRIAWIHSPAEEFKNGNGTLWFSDNATIVFVSVDHFMIHDPEKDLRMVLME